MKRRIYGKLLKRGIDKEFAGEALEKFFPYENNLELALESAKKKLHSVKHKPPEKQKSVLIGHLRRYGYDWDVIKQVIHKFFNEHE